MAASTGYYLYGFTDCGKFLDNNRSGIAGGGPVHNIPVQGIGILCSPINGKKLKPNRDNLLSHQKIIEEWMKEYTILPVRFGVIAQSKGALRNGIRSTLPLIRSKLQGFKGKYELNLKAFWGKEFIYRHILDQYPEIKRFRDRIARIKGPQVHHKSIELGQWVERAIVAENEKEANGIINEITPATLKYKKNKLFGELMFLNLAILSNCESEQTLDQLVNKAAEKREGKVKFKYIGPTAPASFVDIHLKF